MRVNVDKHKTIRIEVELDIDIWVHARVRVQNMCVQTCARVPLIQRAHARPRDILRARA